MIKKILIAVSLCAWIYSAQNNVQTITTSLHEAIRAQDVELVSRIIHANTCDINGIEEIELEIAGYSKKKFKRTPLTLAARLGNLPIVQMLIKREALVNKFDGDHTPLTIAAGYGQRLS